MMKIVFLLLLLSTPAFAQKPVEPIRVSLTMPDDRGNLELRKLIRAELPRGVVFTGERWDYGVSVVAAPLTNDNRCAGVVASLLVVDKADKGTQHHSLFLGDSLRSLARQIAERLERDFFTKRRRAPK